MSFGEPVKGIAGQELLSDLTLNSMLCVRCLAMGFHPSKAPVQGSIPARPTADGRLLHSGGHSSTPDHTDAGSGGRPPHQVRKDRNCAYFSQLLWGTLAGDFSQFNKVSGGGRMRTDRVDYVGAAQAYDKTYFVLLILHHLIRRQRAGDVRVDLDLHGRMIDFEALGEIAAQLVEKRVAGMAVRHDEMAGERAFRGAHRPDMQIMHVNDAGARRQEVPHRRWIDLRRDRRHRHADGISAEGPRCPTR